MGVSGRGSRDSQPQREMGPALRLTQLSPACGPCRSRKLDARRFNAAPIGLLRTQPLRGVSSPGARAGAGSVGGWVWSRGPPLSPGGSETDLSTRTSNGSALPEGFAEPRHGPEIPAFPTLRPRGFNSPGSGLPLGRNPQAHLVSFLDHAAFAVASIRFQNPLFGAGLSAFVSKGPIPVSMSGRCGAGAIRATANRPTYPLSVVLPVDKSG